MTIDISDERAPDSQNDKKSRNKKEKKNDIESVPFGRVFSLNKPEWHLIAIGCIFSLISGAVQPAFSIILAKAVGVCISNKLLYLKKYFIYITKR